MKDFNIVLTGVGGQGVLTLGIIISEAALIEGHDIKTTELHGLSQRGGSIPFQIRFGDVIHSPLVMEGDADLIVSLEPVEALRACYYASKKTKVVFDENFLIPVSVTSGGEKYPSLDEIKKNLKGFSSEVYSLKASEIVKKETGSDVAANVFILGFLVGKKMLPLKTENIIKGLEKTIPSKYLELNKKIFEMGMNYK